MTVLGALLLKEAREIVRDPVTLTISFVMPLVLLFLFAYGMQLDVDVVPIAIVDMDASPASRAFIARLSSTPTFEVRAVKRDFRTAEPSLRRAAVDAIVTLPFGFGTDLARGRPIDVEAVLDGSYPPRASLAESYLDGALTTMSLERIALTERRMGFYAPAFGTVDLLPRVLYNPGLRSAVFVVSGLGGVILLTFPPLLSCLAFVRERERGTIAQIVLAGVPPWAVVLAKLGPYTIVGVIEMALIAGIGIWWFDVPFRGDLVGFSLASVLYVVTATAIGLVISTLTRSPAVAMLASLVSTLMPAMLFSGFIYPIDNMPVAIQHYAHVVPARFFIALSRDVWLKGVPVINESSALMSLAATAAVLLAVATWRVRGILR